MKELLTDEALVAKMNAMEDREIIALLKGGDGEAWHYIELRTIFPMMRSPRLGRIAADRGLSDAEVGNIVYEMLFAKKKIDLFEFRCPLVYWIRNWVTKAILGYCEKFDNPVSQEKVDAVFKDRAAPEYDREGFEIARKCFARLWREKRLWASVHYLKVISEMSSREIMKLLHLSTEANVNQIFSRACKAMRSYRDELERPNCKLLNVGGGARALETGREVADELS